ncbi:MAG: MerR family transcriptional regulator [Fibrobacter sp.]|nr:MerR family transcriptional regulator [Fibrobacter sp.]
MRYGSLKIEKVYWSTREVSEMIGVPEYTLRYWEKHIPELSVPRNRAGKRTWRKQDIELVKELKAKNAKPLPPHNPDPEVLRELRAQVLQALSKLRK